MYFLQIHSLAIPPAENAKAMTKYARTCRKSGRNDLAYKVLASTITPESGEPFNFSAVVSCRRLFKPVHVHELIVQHSLQTSILV